MITYANIILFQILLFSITKKSLILGNNCFFLAFRSLSRNFVSD